MKFGFLKHRLMNAAEDLSNETVSHEDFGGNDVFLEPQTNDVMKELGLDPSKYGLDEVQSEAPKEESYGSDENQEAAPPAEENANLAWVNSLGAIHNDQPVKVESIEEVKNALQMYKDYTQKTQTLSEERKGWDSEKSSAQAELQAAIDHFNTHAKGHDESLQELQKWTFALNQLKESDPDLHAEVTTAYERTNKQFSNPVLDHQLSAVNKRLEDAEKKLASREDKLILDSFDTEKSAMTDTEQSLKELGINIDWADVKKQWAATGMPLKNVVGSIYFENVAKAQASKSKVETTAKKVAARPIGAASASRPGNKVPQIDRSKSLFEQAQELYKNMK
jgi:hypothetical protein